MYGILSKVSMVLLVLCSSDEHKQHHWNSQHYLGRWPKVFKIWRLHNRGPTRSAGLEPAEELCWFIWDPQSLCTWPVILGHRLLPSEPKTTSLKYVYLHYEFWQDLEKRTLKVFKLSFKSCHCHFPQWQRTCGTTYFSHMNTNPDGAYQKGW